MKKHIDTLTRGGFCILWISAFIMAFEEILFAATTFPGPEQNRYATFALVAGVIGVFGASMHAHLLNERDKEE